LLYHASIYINVKTDITMSMIAMSLRKISILNTIFMKKLV